MAIVCPGCGAAVGSEGLGPGGPAACPGCGRPLASRRDHSYESAALGRLLEDCRAERGEPAGVKVRIGAARPAPWRALPEPWFYRALELFAGTLLVLVLVGMVAVVGVPLAVAGDLLGLGPVQFQAYKTPLAGVVLVLGLALVRVLLQAAALVLFVDAARNLRAVRQALDRGDAAGRGARD